MDTSQFAWSKLEISICGQVIETLPVKFNHKKPRIIYLKVLRSGNRIRSKRRAIALVDYINKNRRF